MPIRSTPMPEQTLDKPAAVKTLNKILELELAGVARYTHYSFMVFGYNRIPIVSWRRDQASESLQHAYEAGEMITLLGEHPSLAIGPLLETHSHDIGDILRESLEHEQPKQQTNKPPHHKQQTTTARASLARFAAYPECRHHHAQVRAVRRSAAA